MEDNSNSILAAPKRTPWNKAIAKAVADTLDSCE
jgi:hypothetical protein